MSGKIVCAFILLTLFSCEEAEKTFNYIEVTITGEAILVELEGDILIMDRGLEGEPVEMSLVKAGGERFDDTGTTGFGGITSITTTFNLYKEQPIKFIARPVNYPELLQSVYFTWEEAESIAGGGGLGQPRTASKKLSLIFGVPVDN